jgi:sec-independent protein translocase protein TatA
MKEKMMGAWGPLHWLVVLVVIVLVFGTKKLGNVGSDLGKAIKGFKDGMKGEEGKTATQNDPAPQVKEKVTIDVETKEKTRS